MRTRLDAANAPGGDGKVDDSALPDRAFANCEPQPELLPSLVSDYTTRLKVR
jgi:hypothetical protein